MTWSGITVGSVGDTCARFRLTTDGSINSNNPGGAASDGEVEDYQIAIAAPVVNNPLIDVAKKIVEITGTEVTLDFAIENFGEVK